MLLHYFTKNMLLRSDVFSLYGNNLLIFSMKNIKLNLCADYYGNAIHQFLLNKKIIDFFPKDSAYSELFNVK